MLVTSACVAEAAPPPGEAARLEAARLEAARLEAARLEAASLELLEMSALELSERALLAAEAPVPALRAPAQLEPHDPGELPRWIEHPTLRRETLDELALRYGVTVESLRGWNDMDANAQLHPSRPRSLRVRARRYPAPREALRYEVVAGDIWAGVARRHGVNDRHLRAWNVDTVGRSLDPGEVLEIWIDPVVFASISSDAPADARAAMVRPGAHGVGVPQAGSLVAGVQIPPGEGYWLRYPKSAYGTTYAVRETVAALDQFVATSGHPHPISVGTMSRMRGGEIGHHHSHQTGRDLDIRLPLRPEVPQALTPTKSRIDWDMSYELVQVFARRESTAVIFLDYQCQRRLRRAAEARGVDEAELDALLQFPRGPGASLGVVRHSPGHDKHIHVRFTCGPDEPSCADR